MSNHRIVQEKHSPASPRLPCRAVERHVTNGRNWFVPAASMAKVAINKPTSTAESPERGDEPQNFSLRLCVSAVRDLL
jgi:hypothetical protein